MKKTKSKLNIPGEEGKGKVIISLCTQTKTGSRGKDEEGVSFSKEV